MLPVVVVRGPCVSWVVGCVGRCGWGVLRTEYGGVLEVTQRVLIGVPVSDSDHPH